MFFVVIPVLISCVSGIYVTTNVSEPQEENPAIWTEQELWGPVLENWVIGNQRDSRIFQIKENVTDEICNNTTEEMVKESKISPGIRITNGPSPTKKPPGKPISETDLYLLGAMEKLVFRLDSMEKRVKKLEEMLYFVMAGNRIDYDPCPENLIRIGTKCYMFASTAGREVDWKAASKICKKYKASLIEVETVEENKQLIEYIQTQITLRGKDFWTGGLNPGLLWIWSNSARPVQVFNNYPNRETASSTSDGRCLRLAYNHNSKSYTYRGTDCSRRYNYICEAVEDTASNELTRLGRDRKILDF